MTLISKSLNRTTWTLVVLLREWIHHNNFSLVIDPNGIHCFPPVASSVRLKKPCRDAVSLLLSFLNISNMKLFSKSFSAVTPHNTNFANQRPISSVYFAHCMPSILKFSNIITRLWLDLISVHPNWEYEEKVDRFIFRLSKVCY